MLNFQCVSVVISINFQLHVQLKLQLLIVFALVSVLNGWERMCAHDDMHVSELPYIRSTTMLTMSALCQLLGWIFNLYGHSLICGCMLCLLLYLFLLELLLEHMAILLYSVL